MPQFLLKKYNSEVTLLVWQIKETENELLSMLPSSILLDPTFATIVLEHLRLEFLVGRLCVYNLCNLLNIKIIDIKKDKHGKPFMIGNNWDMSLTHSKDFVAVAIHPTKPLGIDIEKPSEKLKKVMPRLFSESENIQVKNDIIRMSWFWSAKEALYKLYGKRGLDFKNNLFLNLTPTGFSGKISINEHQSVHQIEVERIEDYFLIIAV